MASPSHPRQYLHAVHELCRKEAAGITQFATRIAESPWTVVFPLIGAGMMVLGPVAQAALRLGLWLQAIVVALSSFLFIGYVMSVNYLSRRWLMARLRGLDLENAKHALTVAKRLSWNRIMMLLLLIPFILDEIYIHTTSLSNLSIEVYSVGSFFSLGFIIYLAIYLVQYVWHSRDPLSGAALYFAASAAADEISSSIKLAASATEFLSKAVTKETGVLRIKAPESFFTVLFFDDRRNETLIQLAKSCRDPKSAIAALGAAAHTSADSILEHATLRGRILALPLDGILGILAVLVEVISRLMK